MTNKTNLVCPLCGHIQETNVPDDGCLAFYKCGKCNEVISVPKESKNCCVVCEYSDDVCPVANKN